MDGESRQELVRWAAALARSDVAELRAAGRAIGTLCAENEELERRLARLEPPDSSSGDGVEASPGEPRRARKPKRPLPWRRALVVSALAAFGSSSAAVAAVRLPDAPAAGKLAS